MNYVRNILAFALIGLIVGGCGGGNTTVATNNATSNTSVLSTTTSSTTTTTTTTASPTLTPSPGPTTSSVTLQWSAPTTWADTSAASLSDITGYHIYYGSSATNTPNVINITDGTATQHTVTLPSGSYYFRISAIDSNGYEGLLSPAIQKTF